MKIDKFYYQLFVRNPVKSCKYQQNKLLHEDDDKYIYERCRKMFNGVIAMKNFEIK